MICMKRQQRNAFTALGAAGVLWGLTVPLSKLALAWLSPAWLTSARFAIAAAVLGWTARRHLRRALTPGVLGSGAVGFGGVVMLQNAGIERTSVSAAAVVIGTVPVLVAVLAAATGANSTSDRWVGNVLALVGVSLLAGIGGGGTILGDGLVFSSSVLSAALVVVQPRLLADRDAAAVTAVQFAAAALVALPIAMATGGAPRTSLSATAGASFLALALAGTVLPFWLFAAGQSRVRPEVAGAYLNLEPLVGAAVGWVGFGDRAGPLQIIGVVTVLAGIALSTRSGQARTRAWSRRGGDRARPAAASGGLRDEGNAMGPAAARSAGPKHERPCLVALSETRQRDLSPGASAIPGRTFDRRGRKRSATRPCDCIGACSASGQGTPPGCAERPCSCWERELSSSAGAARAPARARAPVQARAPSPRPVKRGPRQWPHPTVRSVPRECLWRTVRRSRRPRARRRARRSTESSVPRSSRSFTTFTPTFRCS